jgi:hypothetical protein
MVHGKILFVENLQKRECKVLIVVGLMYFFHGDNMSSLFYCEFTKQVWKFVFVELATNCTDLTLGMIFSLFAVKATWGL